MKQLKNLSKYPDLTTASTKAEEPVIVSDLSKKGQKQKVSDLLSYQGVKELTIPGSFLNIITEITSLPVTLLIDILQVSRSTFYRIKDDKKLEQDMVDKLASILKLYNRGVKAFESKEDFHTWLSSKVVTLNNQRPLDLLRSENGRLAVSEAIDRIEYSVYG